MRIVRFILFVCILVFAPAFLQSQCPVADSVLSAIARIQQPGTDMKKLLSQLLTYEDQFKTCGTKADSVEVRLLRATGVVYSILQDYDKAVDFTNRSIGAARKITNDPSLQNKLLLDAYFNLYYYYLYYLPSELQPRIEAVDSCIAIDRRINSNYLITCSVIGEKVKYLFYKGDYPGCIRNGEMGQALNARYASAIKTQRPDYDSIGIDFFSFTYRVDGLIFLGDLQQAEKLVMDKLAFFKKVNYTYNLGVLYNLIGHVYNLKEDYRSAKLYFTQSHKVNLNFGYPKGSVQSLGKVALILNQHFNMPDSAIWYCKKALGHADKVDSIYILNLIANAYAQKRDFEQAFINYDRAYEKLGLGPKLSGDLVNKLDDELSQKVIEYITGLLMDLGEAKLKEYKVLGKRESLVEAINILTITDHALSRIRTDYSDADTKLFWRSHSRRLYEFAIEACYLSDQKQKAFYFLEKSRAVLLNEQLNDQRWLNSEQIIEQKSLKEIIEKQQRQLAKIKQSSPEYLKLQSGLVSNREKLKNLIHRLRESNPLYYQSYLDTAIISISDVQSKILGGRGSFVELFVGDSAVYIMAISDKKIHFNQLDRHRYVKFLEELENGISVPSNSVAEINNSTQRCRQLYEFLFKGIDFTPGRVIVSPDSQIFPFEILVTNRSGDPKYFIEDYAVSYTYSARYLLNTFRSASNSPGNLLGFAPISFSKSGASLAELGGSDQSLQNLNSYFGQAEEYTGPKATKNNFLNHFSRYGIIQLYTHASAGGGSQEPIIYFSDSVLYLSELIPEKKPLTQLIVLSACETGKGQVYQGEGTFSFNRAFAAIGIPAAVTTLWSVEAESTYKITELFYKFLSEGHPTDVALQKAKIEFLKTASKEKSLPYFWAGPILSGKAEKIEFSKSNYWKWIGVCVGLLFVINVIYGIRQRARSKVS